MKQKGYDYVCVSRSNLKEYKEVETDPVRVKDNRGREIELREVVVENGDSEYYLKVTSPLKALNVGNIQLYPQYREQHPRLKNRP